MEHESAFFNYRKTWLTALTILALSPGSMAGLCKNVHRGQSSGASNFLKGNTAIEATELNESVEANSWKERALLTVAGLLGRKTAEEMSELNNDVSANNSSLKAFLASVAAVTKKLLMKSAN